MAAREDVDLRKPRGSGVFRSSADTGVPIVTTESKLFACPDAASAATVLVEAPRRGSPVAGDAERPTVTGGESNPDTASGLLVRELLRNGSVPMPRRGFVPLEL